MLGFCVLDCASVSVFIDFIRATYLYMSGALAILLFAIVVCFFLSIALSKITIGWEYWFDGRVAQQPANSKYAYRCMCGAYLHLVNVYCIFVQKVPSLARPRSRFAYQIAGPFKYVIRISNNNNDDNNQNRICNIGTQLLHEQYV